MGNYRFLCYNFDNIYKRFYVKSIQKMAIFIFLFCFNFAYASFEQQFKSISWDWIAIIALTTLFFLLLLSLLRDLKERKKECSSQIEIEKCKKSGELSYLQQINKERQESTQQLAHSIHKVTDICDEKVIEELKHNHKALFSSNREEKIFLDVATNKVELQTAAFTVESLLKELRKYGSVEYTQVSDKECFIVADKNVLFDVIFLLHQLQTKEEHIANAKFILTLEANSLKIDLINRFEIEKNIRRVLENGLKPIYSQKQRKYYGVYLYLIKTLLEKINALLTIDSDEKSYQVGVRLPIDIQYNTTEDKTTTHKTLASSKKALILTSGESAHKIAASLEEINTTAQIESIKELNKEIPNFMEYDVVFMESQLFEPILTEYLQSIKPLANFKIIAIAKDKKSGPAAELIDATIENPGNSKELYGSIFALFKDEVIDKNESQKESKSSDIAESIDVKEKTGRVLVADDNRINRHILEYLLKSYGLEVTAVTDGVEALGVMKQQSFDLIILDSIMPNLDGYQTIVEIRKDSHFNATPVVIHTSFSLIKSSMENIFQLGFDSYLPKPFNKNELKALLDRYVQTKANHHKLSKIKEHPLNKEEQKSTLKEFLAIYGNSDRIIEKYIKEGQNKQALSLIGDLEKIASKVGADDFIDVLKRVEQRLQGSKEVESELIYSLSSSLQKFKYSVMQRLNS